MRETFIPVRLFGQLFKRMLWGWAGQCPFQRIGVFVPIVIFGHFTAKEQRINYHADKEDELEKGQKCTY